VLGVEIVLEPVPDEAVEAAVTSARMRADRSFVRRPAVTPAASRSRSGASIALSMPDPLLPSAIASLAGVEPEKSARRSSSAEIPG
jgi:hypothetical protein